MTYCPCRNVVNFSHTSQIHFWFKNHPKTRFKPMDQKIPEISPFPWRMWTPSNTPILSQLHSPP